MNLCHIAGLRIPIVPLIESFHLEKAFKRAENILHPVPAQTHLHLYACTRRISAHALAGPLAYARTRAWYRKIKNGNRVTWDHACSGSLGTFNILCLESHLFHADGARYDVMLAIMVVPVYHFERWLLCVVRLDYTPKNLPIKIRNLRPLSPQTRNFLSPKHEQKSSFQVFHCLVSKKKELQWSDEI